MMERTDYFAAKLAYETDPSDLYDDLAGDGRPVVVDVRSREAWTQGRLPGALSMRHSEIADRAPDEIPTDADVVVYCWSPGCNGGARGALAFAQLGSRVREMIGGFEYWAREGYPIEDADGVHRRPVYPLTGVPRIRTRP